MPLEPAGFADAGAEDAAVMPMPDAGDMADAGGKPAKAVGESCEVREDCESADSEYQDLYPTPCLVNGNNPWPGGYCVDFCQLPEDPFAPPLLARADCPQGSICLPRAQTPDPPQPGEIGACFAECDSDDDCRVDEGYYCRRTFWRPEGEVTFDNGYCAPIHCQSRGCPFSFVCSC